LDGHPWIVFQSSRNLSFNFLMLNVYPREMKLTQAEKKNIKQGKTVYYGNKYGHIFESIPFNLLGV